MSSFGLVEENMELSHNDQAVSSKQQTGGNAHAVVLHCGHISDTVADPSAKSANQLLLY